MKRRSLRLASIVLASLIAGCSGSGSNPAPIASTPLPTSTTAPISTPSAAATVMPASYTVPISNGSTVTIPSFGSQAASSMSFPATGVPSGETVTFSSLTATPAGAPATLSGVSRANGRAPLGAEAGAALDDQLEFTFTFPVTLTLTQTPAVTINTDYPIPIPELNVFAAIFDVTYPTAPAETAVIPGTLTSTPIAPDLQQTTLSFAAQSYPNGLTFTQGHTYFFGVYFAPLATPSPSPTTAPTVSPTSAPTTSPTSAPTTSPTSASASVAIAPAGGSFAIPSFGGFTGSIGYPSNNAPSGTTATLTSSTTSLGGTLASPPNGTSVFYEQLSASSSASSITFNSGTGMGTISSPSLLSTATYSLYVYAIAFGQTQAEGSSNLGSPTNGTLTFASPINGMTFPTSATVELDLVQN